MLMVVELDFSCLEVVEPRPGIIFSISAHAERQLIKAAARKNKRILYVTVTSFLLVMF